MSSITFKIHEQPLELETGVVARQASGAVMIRQGDTMVLSAVAMAPKAGEGRDFLPLTVEYQERKIAAGLFLSGFLKREGRPSEKEILTCRLVDRSIRPLFPQGMFHEVQVINQVMSADPEADSDVLALTATGAALHLSEAPWEGPVVGLRVARVGKRFIANPRVADRMASDMDLVVAVGPTGLVMVEGEAKEVPHDVMVDALLWAQEMAQPGLLAIDAWRQEHGKAKTEIKLAAVPPEILEAMTALTEGEVRGAITIPEKALRQSRLSEIQAQATSTLREQFPEQEAPIALSFKKVASRALREITLQGSRIDGRAHDQIRPISIRVGWLPRVHGSALFTRGETQAMVSCALGTTQDAQRMDTLFGEASKRFYLHYNFPPYSVGEVRSFRGPGRREIGHGHLAERALRQVMPGPEEFPHVVRVVSDISESNGSSSMASVCGGCLALMDAGVPVRTAVAGVAMGLLKAEESTAVLTDILGDEDHLGDMDFKVCGTKAGLVALQMDIKVKGLDRPILEGALGQARRGLDYILGKMAEALAEPRPNLHRNAPRIFVLKVRPDRIRDLIGPGGRNIQSISQSTGATVEVDQKGIVQIAAPEEASARMALRMAQAFTLEPEVGKVYKGLVVKVRDFGIFVEIGPNTEGFVHISELEHGRTERVEAVVKEGDTVQVRVKGVDNRGRIVLSRKDALEADLSEIVDLGSW